MDTEGSTQLVVDESYETFRARIRETFLGLEWTCIDSDQEADFLVNDRWELYAAPAGFGLPNSVTIWEFPTETSRRSWDARVEVEADKAKIHRVLSAQEALDLLAQIDPDVVRRS